jgi:CheY-like chemotaxis protein
MNKRGDIIIVEDDPDEWGVLLEIFEQVMDENGYDNRVVIFEESTMVADYLKETPEEPFIILSDINMPFMDGYELREQIATDPEIKWQDVPFIFLTTSDCNEVLLRAENLEVQGCYTKPTQLTDYKELISNILGDFLKHAVI